MPTAIAHLAPRRTLRPEDPAAIEALHAQVYGREYGLNQTFSDSVARDVAAASAGGWPHEHGAVWLIDAGRRGELAGALALTREQPPTVGAVHWFALSPALRGRGIGRQLLTELLTTAREQGIERLALETFSALVTAAHLYRSVGFRLVSSSDHDDWGPMITMQRYELDIACSDRVR